MRLHLHVDLCIIVESQTETVVEWLHPPQNTPWALKQVEQREGMVSFTALFYFTATSAQFCFVLFS